MTAHEDRDVLAHGRKTVKFWDELAVDFLMALWSPEVFHCGLFEEGEIPEDD